MVNRIMSCCARLNNAGTEQLAHGMFADATDSFTASLRLVKSALATLANDAFWKDGVDGRQDPRYQSWLKQETVRPVHHHQKLSEEMQSQLLVSAKGLYLSPLQLAEDIDYGLYSSAIEASIAILFNLALSHHLNGLYGEHNSVRDRQSILGQAVALYELAYTVEMQEEADISVEFTMAIINNLGHVHRSKGNQEKSQQCFRHLLSTILFLQSCGQTNCRMDDFVQSISHLILCGAAAPAA